MILRAAWKSSQSVERRAVQVRTELGSGKLWLEVDKGRGSLLLAFEFARCGSYIDPRRFSALGALGLIEFPAIGGENLQIVIAGVSKEWIESADSLFPIFGRLGFKVRLAGRTMELVSSDAPSVAIEKLGLLFLALDRTVRPVVNRQILTTAQHRAVKLLDDDAEELLLLLDPDAGRFKLAELFSEPFKRWEKSPRERAIVPIVKRLEPRALVQFECGRGRFLRELALALHCEKVLGIDGSLLRVEAASQQLGLLGEAKHGSITEPPFGIPTDGVALLVDSLPTSTPTRLERASEVLFGDLGFEWVLCVELQNKSELLADWMAAIARSYCYRAKSWTMGASDRVVLFRRRESSPERRATPLTESVKKIETARGVVSITQRQWAESLETFSKWTVDPRWLLYLPPGMASLQRDRDDGFLEHIADAFDYYRSEGIDSAVVELKHMGSRAIVVLCRDSETAMVRFGSKQLGCIYTRTGRAFFEDNTEILASLRDGLSRAHFWEKFKSDWVCFDGEVLPWTLKAERLIEEKHGELLALGESAHQLLEKYLRRSAPEEGSWLSQERAAHEKYRRLYERYESEKDASVRFAPFHLVATEGAVHLRRNHHWHMSTLGRFVRHAGLPYLETPYRFVHLRNAEEVASCIQWWEKLSSVGEEGVVVKPLYFQPRGRRGLAQPAIKCRGREHLRLVYGPDYDLPEKRLALIDRDAFARRRNKHREILRQLDLSIEAVERFANKEPVGRIEECVRGVFALQCQY